MTQYVASQQTQESGVPAKSREELESEAISKFISEERTDYCIGWGVGATRIVVRHPPSLSLHL